MTSIVDLPSEGGWLWLLTFWGVTVIVNDTVPYLIVEESSVVSVLFLKLWNIDLYVLADVNELQQR